MRATAMILAALAGQAAPPISSAPLQPSGPWLIEYEDSICILSRPYGEKSDHIQFAITVDPTELITTIVLLFGKPIKLKSSGKAVVELEGLTSLATSSFISGLSKDGQNRIVRISLANVDIGSVFSTSIVRIELDGQPAQRIALRTTKDVRAALAQCTDDLLTSWGLDPQIQRKTATRAKPLTDQTTWISVDDYPSLALANDHEGSVRIVWIIGLDGRARDCKAVLSSGFAELDGAACTAITARARYLPAKGSNGESIISYGTRVIRWVIPR